MAYHARPCQFVTLSPLLLCIIHGYPPRPCVVVPHRPFSPSLPRRFYRFCFPRCTSSPSLPHPFPTCLGTSLSICLPFRLFSVVHLVPAGLPVARCFSLVLSSTFLSVYFPARMRWRGDEWVRRIVIMRSHLSRLAPLESKSAAGPEMATERRKRLQTGAGGNDSVATMTMALAMAMAMAMVTATADDDCESLSARRIPLAKIGRAHV